VLARGGDIRLEGVEIAANTAARSGGGVLVEGGTASVLKATLHGDGAGQAGGAIAVLGAGSAQIDSATIIGNSAAGFAGGGVFFGGAWAASDLSRSIGAGNAAAQGADVALVGGAWGGADNLFGVAALTDGRPRHEIPAGMAQALADDGIAPGAVFDAIEPVTGGGQAGRRQARPWRRPPGSTNPPLTRSRPMRASTRRGWRATPRSSIRSARGWRTSARSRRCARRCRAVSASCPRARPCRAICRAAPPI
jgi:hypothetical protein